MEFTTEELRVIIDALVAYERGVPSSLVDHFGRELEKMELYDASFADFNDCGDACKL